MFKDNKIWSVSSSLNSTVTQKMRYPHSFHADIKQTILLPKHSKDYYKKVCLEYIKPPASISAASTFLHWYRSSVRGEAVVYSTCKMKYENQGKLSIDNGTSGSRFIVKRSWFIWNLSWVLWSFLGNLSSPKPAS